MVPAAALPVGTTVSVYPVVNPAPLQAMLPTNLSYVASLAVVWVTPTNTSPDTAVPITMTISDPSIIAGDHVYELTSSGLTDVGTATVDGSVTITFSSDPTFIVTKPHLIAQSPISITSLIGSAGNPLSLVTSGGRGTGTLSFTINDGTASDCAISGSSLTAQGAGTCVVTATKAADSTYVSASSAPTVITLALNAQSPISITSLIGSAGNPLSLVTSGGRGTGTLSFTINDGTASDCAISGSSLTAQGAGTCVVTATKAADSTYVSASSAPTVITLIKAVIAKPATAVPATIRVTFTFYSSALSNSTRTALLNLSRKLTRGDSLTLIGYADFDIPLATSRAIAVKKFLLGIAKVKIKIQIVTNLPIRKVEVITTTT